MAGIDYDRGVIIRVHPLTVMDVCMYRREPGIYYTSTGIVIPEALAAAAGFDVETHARAKRKREVLDEFAAKLDREETAEVQAAQTKPKDIVHEVDGFKVVALGNGRHAVEDQDGNVLTGQGKFITRDVAIKLVDEMADGLRKRAAKAAPKPKPAPVA